MVFFRSTTNPKTFEVLIVKNQEHIRYCSKNMGGNAAKERRRLKRLAEENQSNGGEPAKTVTAIPESAPEKSSNPKPQGVKTTTEPKSKDKTPFAKKDNAFNSKSKFQLDKTGKGNRTNGAAVNDSKFKKPKHLARKVNAAGDRDAPSGTRDRMRKPKHLARKINDASDPKEMEELMKKQEVLLGKKTERAKRFKERVIKAVGGLEYFNEEMYTSLMENGGGKIESIIEAVKVGNDADSPIAAAPSAPKAIAEKEGEAKKSIIEAVKVGNDAGSPIAAAPSAPKAIIEKEGETKSTSENNEEKIMTADNAGANSKAENSFVEKEVDEKSTLENNKEDAAGDKSKAEDGEKEKRSSSASSSSSGSDDSGSDSDGDANDQNARTRGRKRRGRKEADAKRDELNTKQQEEAEIAKAKEEGAVKTPKSQDKRRCIGRKPVTDFKIGSKYTGTVRYVRPGLGLFIDIGCHSDAFCHISRAGDTFVDNITDLFKVGDELENKVRIVEVDRRKKRITVSLQSDQKAADEEKSARDHKVRLEGKAAKKRKTEAFGSAGAVRNDFNSASPVKTEEIKSKETKMPIQDDPKDRVREEVPIIIDPDNMTPAELKRARKLQRRAERRKQEELTGIAA